MRILRTAHRGPGKVAGALLLALLTLSLAACASKRTGSIPYGPQNFGAPDPIDYSQFSQTYRIGPGDVLSVTVYRVPNLSGDLQVNDKGTMIMPLLGAVAVQGKTDVEVAADLTQALASKYLQNPQVQVVVKSHTPMVVTVDGAVTQPGIYPIEGQTSLVQAVAMARGPSTDANERRVVVFRTLNGQRMAAAFDLRDIRNGRMADPKIYPRDIVVVDENRMRSRFHDIVNAMPLAAFFRPF